jgi:hypothetical protein
MSCSGSSIAPKGWRGSTHVIPCCHLACSHALPGEISRANFRACGSGCRVVLQASSCYAGGIILHRKFFWQMQRSRGDCGIRCDSPHHVQLASAALALAICRAVASQLLGGWLRGRLTTVSWPYLAVRTHALRGRRAFYCHRPCH